MSSLTTVCFMEKKREKDSQNMKDRLIYAIELTEDVFQMQRLLGRHKEELLQLGMDYDLAYAKNFHVTDAITLFIIENDSYYLHMAWKVLTHTYDIGDRCYVCNDGSFIEGEFVEGIQF